MNCVFCNREINNKGSLIAHEKVCKNNPNRIKYKKSPKAGSQKGDPSPHKGKKFPEVTTRRLIEKIENGEYKKYCEYHVRRVVKDYLILKYGNKCMSCGLEKWLDETIPLVCDHIDGNPENHELDNLRIICNNCDSISKTFKGKNRGSGRKNRYTKINEG
jgi:hypothetical protein